MGIQSAAYVDGLLKSRRFDGMLDCQQEAPFEDHSRYDGVKRSTAADAERNQEAPPTSAANRKAAPAARGVLDYFPDAILAVANLSFVGNEQHNPGEPMHWAREKSTDHADCIVRHLIDRGKFDTDGVRHSAKVAWRALALLQLEIEAAKERVGTTLPGS